MGLENVALNPEKIQVILKVFSKLPYQILWKFDNPDWPGKPPNVRIEKWLPQNDILAHENIKLFITHGGLLSTIEAVYHAVPIIGVPFMCDQYENIAVAEDRGIGKGIDLSAVTEQTFMETIKEVIENPM